MGQQKMVVVCVFEQLNLQIFGSLMKNIVFFWFVNFGSRKNLISKEGFGVSNDGQKPKNRWYTLDLPHPPCNSHKQDYYMFRLF